MNRVNGWTWKAAYGAGENYQAKPRLHIDESFAGTAAVATPFNFSGRAPLKLVSQYRAGRTGGFGQHAVCALSTENHMLGVLSIYTDQPLSFLDR